MTTQMSRMMMSTENENKINIENVKGLKLLWNPFHNSIKKMMINITISFSKLRYKTPAKDILMFRIIRKFSSE